MRGVDVLVIGAGVFGLSVGWAAVRAGLSVRVLEAGHVGAGASGGPVGALAPHAPGRWGALQAFQLAALLALPRRVAEIEAASGRSTGYARPGRLMPLVTAEARLGAEADALAATKRWGSAGRWEVLDRPPREHTGWLAPESAPHGVVRDSLTARIDPPAYLAALSSCLGDAVARGRVLDIDADQLAVVTATDRIPARNIVVAAGWRSWELITPFAPQLSGSAVKGQAALLAGAAAAGSAAPLITAPGLFIVPHARGVAVGSTSERGYADPSATDGQLDAVIARARAMCPALAATPVVARWAGLRPKPPGRVPVAGPLPRHPGLWIASGGYRIGLGIAHAIADALVAEMTGEPPPIALPPAFRPQDG